MEIGFLWLRYHSRYLKQLIITAVVSVYFTGKAQVLLNEDFFLLVCFFFFSFRSSAKLVAPLGCLVSRQKHTLPDLPYDYAALEPHINAEIMQLHHSKHHATYVNNLNVAEEKYKEALAKGLYIHSQQGRWKLIGIDDTGELKKKKKKREMFSFKSFGLCHCNIVRRKSFIVASVVLIIGNQM